MSTIQLQNNAIIFINGGKETRVDIPGLSNLGISTSSPNFHDYQVIEGLSKDFQIPIDTIARKLREEPGPPLTGSYGREVLNGEWTNLYGIDPVKTYISTDGRTIVNVTQPGHNFYPGIIVR